MATSKSEKPPAKRAPAKSAVASAAAPVKQAAPAKKHALLSGGNPQIAKADGDAPVQAYIDGIPDGWRRELCAHLDALAATHIPRVHKAIRWNSPFYGRKGEGWFVGFHVFTGFIKVTFFQGASLQPAPTGGTGEDARWINIHEGGLDEAQMAAWIKQAAALPGWGTN